MITNSSTGTTNNYVFGAGNTVIVALTASNAYGIYFGNHDTTGSITATLTGTY